jgi:hypothetical protein
MLGALMVELANGKQLKIGTGFSGIVFFFVTYLFRLLLLLFIYLFISYYLLFIYLFCCADAERKHPPKIGSVVSFKYQEISEDGIPRFPVSFLFYFYFIFIFNVIIRFILILFLFCFDRYFCV